MVVINRLAKYIHGILSIGKIPMIIICLFWVSILDGIALNVSVIPLNYTGIGSSVGLFEDFENSSIGFSAIPVSSVTSVTGTSPLCIAANATYTANGVNLDGGTGAWSSSDLAVATVNAGTGLVTAVAAGTCNIVYTITGGVGGPVSAQQTLTVLPNAAVTSVTGSSPLCRTAATTFTANGIVLGGGTGTWSSNNTSVATVNSATGFVTAVGAGTCNIIYTITGGCGGTVAQQQALTVTPDAAISSVTGGSPLCRGASTTYTTTGLVLGGGTGVWSSSDATVATVNSATGIVTAVGTGTCNIIYTINGGCNGLPAPSAQKSLTVTPDAAVISVTGTSPLCRTATATYTANGVVLGGGTGTWSSSNTSVATVNAISGLVTAVGAGTCNIIYTITGGCNGTPNTSQPITVTPDAAVTSVSGASPLCSGATTTFTANGVVLGGGTGQWSSSNTSVATVNVTTGLVTAVGAGTCNIIYTIVGGCTGSPSATRPFTVTPNAAITSVTGTSPLCRGISAAYSANGVVLGGGAGAWSSTNLAVANVDAATGVVTAVGIGTCDIIYTITGGCGGTQSAQRSVTVTADAAIASVTGTSPLCRTGTTTFLANGVVLGGGTGTWSSSNAAVATVNNVSGLVTATGAGTCNIIYTITGGCGGTISSSQSLTVTPDAAITSVTGASPLCRGASATYTANGAVLGGGTGTWSSSNAAVATVNPATGVVTAVGTGSCNIIYTISGGCVANVSAQRALTVTANAAVTSVSGMNILCRTTTATYNANGVVLGGGTGAWSSSNVAVATVNSASGLVTAVGAGTCNIIYTISGGCNGTPSAQQSLTVTANIPVHAVLGTTPLCKAQTATYSVNGIVLGAGTGTWSSSDTSVATVNSTSGLVTAVDVGSCEIIFTIAGGCSAQQTLIVSPDAAVTSVSGTNTLCRTATTTFTATGVVLAGGTGNWSSDNTSVATVNNTNGFVTAVGVGTCNISYTITGGCNGTPSQQQSLTVTPDAAVASVTGPATMCNTGTTTFVATGVVLSGGSGSWSSSNTAVATVNAGTGFVTAVGVGSCNIIYTVSGGCNGPASAQKALTVYPNVAVASVTGTTPLCRTATATYSANGVILAGGTGTWSSSNNLVATVDAVTGVVTAVGAGTCNITYTINGGCNGTPIASQSLTVTPDAAVASVSGTSPLCSGATVTYTAAGVVLSGGTGAWSSSNPAVATVNALTGAVTAVGAGTSNIIYTVSGGCTGPKSAQQSLTVTPNAAAGVVSGTTTMCKTETATYVTTGALLSGGTGAWSSSNLAVATVNATTGFVTAVGSGTCNIVYTITGGCGGTQTAQQSLTVVGVTSVSGTTPLCRNGTATYTTTGAVLGGGTGAWSSSNTAVATVVPATGVVTGVGPGSCDIIYTINGGCSGTPSARQTLVVTPDAFAGTVSGTSPLCQTATAIFTTTGVVLGGGTGAWSSSNPSIAAVHPTTGLVTALGVGSCNIIYTITGGCNGTPTSSLPLTVNAIASITSVSGTTPLCRTATATYSANGVVLAGGTGTWSSNNIAVATVDAVTGVVTAVAPGTCNISYTITGGCGNGTPGATQSLTVTADAAVASVSGTSPLCSGATVTYTAAGVVLSGGTGAWSSSNPAVATVNALTGAVTAVGAGTSNIVYTISGGCGGTKSAQQTLTVSGNAAIASVSGPSPLCKTETATYVGNGVVLGGGTGVWSSSNPAVATVNATTGFVTAVGSGTCNIIYTITGGCGGTQSAQQSITVVGVTSVSGTTPLCRTSSATYTTSGAVLGAFGTGVWSSSNTAVATVIPATGVVTAVGAGSCEIIYTINGGCSGTPSARQTLVVTPDAFPGTVSGTSPLCQTATTVFTANGAVLGGGTGAWSSSNPSIATVHPTTGLVTALGAGTCNIIYTITGGCNGTPTASQSLTVNAVASIASVSGTTPLCRTATATYTTTGAILAGGTGTWSSSNLAVATVDAVTGVVTAVGAGTSNITYTISGGCGNGTPNASQLLTVTPDAAVASVSGTTPLCGGATATYAAAGVVLSGGTGAWSSSNPAVATVHPVTGVVTAVGTGTCNIIYTITGGCTGTKSAQQSLTVSPDAAVVSVSGTTPLCRTATANYTAIGVVLGGGTGAWSSDNTAIATVNPTTGVVTAVGAGSCNIVYTITGGCGGTKTASLVLTVTPNSAITSVNGTTPLCRNTTATYTTTGVVLGGGTGAWSSSNISIATVDAVTGVVTAVGAGTCNIIFTITGGCNGPQFAQKPLTVTPDAAVASVTGTSPLCRNSTSSYTANGVVLGGGTGTWSSSNALVATVNPATGLVTAVGLGTCDIIYTIAGGCNGTPSAAKTLTVNPTPVLSSTLTPPAICSGSAFSYIPSSVTLGSTFSWTRLAVAGISQPTGIGSGNVNEFLTNTSALPVNVTYKYTTTFNGCSSIQDVVVTVNPEPTLTSGLTVPPLCTGSTFSYTATSNTPGATFAWSRATVIGITQPGTAGATANINEILSNTSPAPLQVTYVFTVSANGCTNVATYSVVVTVYPVPTKPVITVTGSNPVCQGNTVSLASSANNSYIWSNGATTQSINVGTAGTYRVVVGDVAGCTSVPSDPVIVLVNPAPAAPTSGGDIKQCVNAVPQTITAMATLPPGLPAGSTIKWYSSSTGGVALATPNDTGTGPSLTGLGNVTYYAETKNFATNCISLLRTPVNLSIVSHPAAPVKGVDISNDLTICETNPITTLTAGNLIAPPPGTTILWYTGTTGGAPVTPTLGIVGTITYYAEANNGFCSSNLPRTAVTLTINPAPAKPTSLAVAPKCAEPVIVPLTATATAIGSTISWYTSSAGGTAIVGTPTLSQTGTVTYYAEAKDPLTQCVSLERSAPVVLTINVTPDQPVTIKPIDETCQTSGTTTLTATATASGGATVSWYTAATGGTLVATPTLSTPSTVTYWAQATLGTCTSVSPRTTSVRLTINPAPPAPVSSGNIEKCAESPTIAPINANTKITSSSTVEWFTAATGGSPISDPPTLDKVGSISYFAAAKSASGCYSLTRTEVKLTINETPENPIVDNATMVGCEANPIIPLTASAKTATAGATINWYTGASGGSPISGLPTLSKVSTTPVIYYAEAMKGTCPSPGPRPSVSLLINAAPAPPKLVTTPLDPCASNPLFATGDFDSRVTSVNPVQWYSNANDVTPLARTPKFSELSVGTTTYYAGSVNNSTTCQSLTRIPVSVTVTALPADPVTTKPEDYVCATSSPQTLTATATSPDGATIKWYRAATGGSPISGLPSVNISTATAQDYYAEAVSGTCVSAKRTKVSLWIVPVPGVPVVGFTSKTVCEGSTEIPLTATATSANSASINWYTTLTGGLPVENPTLSAPGTITYYAEGVSAYLTSINGYCTSTARSKPVVLTINAIPADPVTTKPEDFVCATSPLQTLTATATSPDPTAVIKWYKVPTGGTPISGLPTTSVATTAAVDYYAEAVNGTCISSKRTKVSLWIVPVPGVPVVDFTSKTVCEGSTEIPLKATATSTNSAAITWYTAATGGSPVDNPTWSKPGTITYYAEGVSAYLTSIGGFCTSVARSKPVVLTITAAPAPPVIDAGNKTVACVTNPITTLIAKANVPIGTTIYWYDTETGTIPVYSPTWSSSGDKAYWAEAKLGSCASLTRTKVLLQNVPLPAVPVPTKTSVVECETVIANGGIDATTLLPVVPGITYHWYDAASGGSVVSPVQNVVGTKTVYVESRTVGSDCASASRAAITMTIQKSPPLPVSKGDIVECSAPAADANTAIVPNSAYTLIWYSRADGGTVVTNPTLTRQAADATYEITYYASYKDPATLCESIGRTAVKLTLQQIFAAKGYSNSPVSPGNTLYLYGGTKDPYTPASDLTYEWKAPNGYVNNTANVTISNASASDAGKYTLTVTSKTGCTSTIDISVIISTANAGYQPVCVGGTLNLMGSPDNMKSYAWTGPDGFSSNIQNPAIDNVTASNGGMYTLETVDPSGKLTTSMVDVRINPLPEPLAMSNSPVCQNGSLELFGGPEGMASYSWTGPGLAPTPPGSSPNYTVSAFREGNYMLTVVDGNGCRNIDTIAVTILRAKPSFTPLCSGTTLHLIGEPNGMAGYTWTGPNGFTSTTQSPTLLNVTPAQLGTYRLIVRDQSGCTSLPDTVRVTSSIPSATIVVSPAVNPICEGTTITLTGGPSSTTVPYSYAWTGPNGFTSTDQNLVITNAKAVNAGVYNLKVSDSKGCSTTTQVSINLIAVKFNGNYGPYCVNDSKVNISVTPAGVVLSGNGIAGSSATGYTFDPAVAKIGVHPISYTYDNGAGCFINGSQDFVVLDNPKVVTNTVVLKACSGVTADLTLPQVTAGSTAGLTFSYWMDSKATSAVAAPTAVGAGLYYIKGATSSGKCWDIQSVTVGQPDSLKASITASPELNCPGDSTGTLTVNITMGTAPFNYQWSTNPVQTTDKATNLKAGIYTVIVTDAKMCSAAFTGEITEPAPIRVSFNVKNIQCLSDANGSARVDSINGSADLKLLNSFKYLWATNPVQTTREATKLTAWWHYVTLTNSKGCVQKDSVFIDVKDTIPPSITCPKDIEMTVQYIKSTDGSPNKYLVELGKPYGLDNCQVDTITNDAPTKFRTGVTYVIWTVYDQIGMVDTCTQKVVIKEIPSVPQLISPNGDGMNDKFMIDGLNAYPDTQMLVFTRSGQLVFRNDNYELPENAWDGRYSEASFSKNQLVAPGVYYYILKLGGPGSQTLKGYIYVYY